MTGNTDTMNAHAATALSPGSSQIDSIGAIAMIGTVWKNTVYGANARRTHTDEPRTSAIATPTIALSANPISDALVVIHRAAPR
jgi:hypothetical protein